MKNKKQIRSVVEDYVSTRVLELVCHMDSVKTREQIEYLLDQEGIKDYDILPQLGNQPFLGPGSKKLTKELTDYFMSKFL